MSVQRSKFDFEEPRRFVGVWCQAENYRSCHNILQEGLARDMQRRMRRKRYLYANLVLDNAFVTNRSRSCGS